MISLKVTDKTKIPAILNHLGVFTFAESLGGVESLITYPTAQTHHDIPLEIRESYGLTDDLLRLSIDRRCSRFNRRSQRSFRKLKNY